MNKPTGVIVFKDGTKIFGTGFGITGSTIGELCFNTAMTGYQEILSDSSYANQIITFTFPHIGNVGTNPEDYEATNIYSKGFIIHEDITSPSNWRATNNLMRWTTENNLIGISAIDTRFLTKLMRDKGLQNVCIAHNERGEFDFDAIIQDLNSWNGVNGVDLAKDVTCTLPYEWDEKQWCAKNGFQREKEYKFHVVVIDYGVKRNILRSLVSHGCKVTVVTASSNIDEILNYNPDGVLLSNGPGDPAATGVYAVPVIKQLIAKKIPIFGICLGHQLLALAVGAKTEKMKFGHHGANHPVKNVQTNKVEITSMNHGFSVNRGSLPTDAIETHTSLFDGSNCGIALKGKPIFSVQFHPEANPGPQDSDYLFAQFVENMRRNSGTSAAA